MAGNKPKLDLCPFCKKLPPSDDRRCFPFCSARCKQADLGAWASESYRIDAGPLTDFEDSENDSDE